MRICFVLPNAWVGGFRTYTLNLGRQFKKDGHIVSIVIASRNLQDSEIGDISEFEEIGKIQLCTTMRVLVRSLFLNKLIRKIDEIKPDVLILNNSVWAQAVLPYLDPKIIRIITVHNVVTEEIKLANENSDYWDVLVAVGAGLEKILLEIWGPERVQLIPVGVLDIRNISPRNFNDSILRICFCGRVEQYQKNVLIIPEIANELFSRNISFHWTIVGDGPDLAKLVERISEIGLKGNFTFKGSCSNKTTQEIISKHHILILPSNFESIGHVLLEAQMLGVLPVASRLAGATDYVVNQDRNGILCEPGNVIDFSQTIENLYNNRKVLEELCKRAEEDVRQEFEISRVAAKYYELVDNLRTKGRNIRKQNRPLGYTRVPKTLLPSRFATFYKLLTRKYLSKLN